MGVGTGVGSMSTTTDVIYTHKKFKRTAAEAWDNKEPQKNAEEEIQRQSEVDVNPANINPGKPNHESSSVSKVLNGFSIEKLSYAVPYKDGKKLMCTLCGFVSSKQTLFEQHVCMHKKQNSLHFVDPISVPAQYHREGNVELSAPKIYQSETPAKTADATRVAFNRSHSLPFGANSLPLSEENPEKTHDSRSSTASSSKQLYKPKFRAQYSFQESALHSQAAPTLSLSSSSILSSKDNHETSLDFSSNSSTHPSFTYHSFTTSSSLSSPSLAHTVAPLDKSIHLPSNESKSPRVDEFPLSKKTSQYSSIWKGIKSPSPELVGQHITNLIVQNQAIVETHNPLWSMKYRRQSSIGSPLTDGEGGTSHKTRKVNDTSRGIKSHCNSLEGSSPEVSVPEVHGDNSSSLLSLPRSYFYQHPLSSPVRASTNISTPSINPISSQPKNLKIVYSPGLITSQCDDYNSCHLVVKNQNYALMPEVSHSLDLSKCPRPQNASALHHNESISDNLHHGNDSQVLSLKQVSQPALFNKVLGEPVHIFDGKNFDEQEVALDLHKHPSLDLEGFSLQGSCNSVKQFHNEDTLTTRDLSVSPTHFQVSPPTKKQKLCSSSDLIITRDKSPSYSPIFTHNGKMVSKNDYQIMTLDDYGKPKSNTHYMSGGEVQICDGKETKTLKIDPIKNEAPSLHLCIASKHLGVDLESKDNQLPTSVVVTIAKCGLNSGGTMVKVENQNTINYGSRKVGYNVVPGQIPTTTSSSKPLLSEKVITCPPHSSSGMPPTSSSFHSSLMHYSNFASIDAQRGSPHLSNTQGQSFKGPAQATAHSSSLGFSTLYDNTGVQQPRNSRDLPPVSHSDTEHSSLPTARPPFYPSVISIGGEVIPHVPGMPGPYSQAGVVFKNSVKLIETSPSPSAASTAESKIKGEKVLNTLYRSVNREFSPPNSTVIAYSPLNSHSPLTDTTALDKSKSKEYTIDSSPKMVVNAPQVNVMGKPPEIRIQSPPQDLVSPQKRVEENTSKLKGESEEKFEEMAVGKTFLIPRKRPNTLMIKPQSLSTNKFSLSLIGSTLVSPDTPRPKKSCAQLFLNGSAYTYLNLKVSTKTFFCCIYRPQPIYVLQSTNPKLSMYSNWQICKTEDPLNISPSEAMSLHVSGLEYNRAYTIAKPKTLQLISTDSSYWLKRSDPGANTSLKQTLPTNYQEATFSHVKDSGDVANKGEVKFSKENVETGKKQQRKSDIEITGNKPKRIKIFEGGFKTNEDYTYVRGRGRGRYVCETCGIRCKKPSMLKKHIRTHTDLRPFACSHCSFSFKTKGNLTKHLKSKAHFKRCTEMGILPVPITANESHVNQEALQLQGTLNQGKGMSQTLEDDDEDDDDDDDPEDDEEEEDADDEEDGDDEDEEEEEDEDGEAKAKVDKHGNISSLTSMTSEAAFSLLEIASPKVTSDFPLLNFMEPKASSMERSGSIDGIMPMDLSIKRHSVISVTSQPEEQQSPSLSSLQENTSRASHLPLIKRLSFDSARSPTATTPIKEQPEDILSPVTESSMVLKSIYSTTRKVSSSNLEKSSVPDHIRGNSCGSAMLHTYLTERAVLDSAKKRHQCLYNYSEDQSPGKRHNILISPINKQAIPMSTSFNYSRSSSSEEIKNCSVKVTKENPNRSLTSLDILPAQPIEKKSALTETDSPVPVIVKKPLPNQSNSNPISFPLTSVSQTAPTSSDVAHPATCSVSSTKAKSSLTSAKLSNNLAVSLSGVVHTISSVGSTIITSLRTTGSNTLTIPSDTRMVSARKSSKISSLANVAASVNISNSMPTPPANLTVLNSCSGDSKTTFIAPSGVIPSPHSNRIGSDEGKCKCSVCHKEFAKQCQLRLHINIHYIERPHRCDSCGISFRTNGHLQKHKRSVSHYNKVNMNMTFGTPSTNNPRPFKCHDCKSAFRIYGHLAKHLRSKLHIMRLECLGKLPIGTYAEIERSGVNLNEIDTSDCGNSLESLQVMAAKLYEKEPAKLLAGQSQQQQQTKHSQHVETRERTMSNSSTNSEEYALDEQESERPSSASTSKSHDDDSGDEEEPMEMRCGEKLPSEVSRSSPPSPAYEIGTGATEGLIGCSKCHQKFLDLKSFELHYFAEHETPSSKETPGESLKGGVDPSLPAGFSSSTPPSVSKL